MEAKELRISNLVYHNGEIIEIKSLHPENDEIPFHAIYGIKITEQWLLDFDFKEMEMFTNVLIKSNLAFLTISNLAIIKAYYMSKPIRANIKYVHQLQNLYFALNNNELIRKL